MVKITDLEDNKELRQELGSEDDEEEGLESMEEDEEEEEQEEEEEEVEDEEDEEEEEEDNDDDEEGEEDESRPPFLHKVTTFWGTHLRPDAEPFTLNNSDNLQQRCTIHLRQATIDFDRQKVGQLNARLELTYEGSTFVLCWLSEKCPQHQMDIYLNPASSVVLKAIGNMAITLTGEYSVWLTRGEIHAILAAS
eukprot:GGOE01013663.1.p1 GENE.GGOE01013663.1~~GGOE01013663.1.p1  ORF type:complete len:194 (+),score=53.56 GGOE01013663.1:32-613(+)